MIHLSCYVIVMNSSTGDVNIYNSVLGKTPLSFIPMLKVAGETMIPLMFVKLVQGLLRLV